MKVKIEKRFAGLEMDNNCRLTTYLHPRYKGFSSSHIAKLVQGTIAQLCDENYEIASVAVAEDEKPTKKRKRDDSPKGSTSQSTDTSLKGAALALILASSSDEESEKNAKSSIIDMVHEYHIEKRLGNDEDQLKCPGFSKRHNESTIDNADKRDQVRLELMCENRLAERAHCRLTPMRYMTSLQEGAGIQVLKKFYTATIRSLITYSAPTLANLSAQQISTIEVIQNNAMRYMMGAPMWTRICNLQMETNLPPLYSWINVSNTNSITKALLSERRSHTQKRLKEALNKHLDLPIPNSYAGRLLKNIYKCNMASELAKINLDKPCTNYKPLVPWRAHPAKFNTTSLPDSKKACTKIQLHEAAQAAITETNQAEGISYYTDGTVKTSIPATGAEVYSEHFTASWRLSDSCSTLQTELFAIKMALQNSMEKGQGPVNIHTDSLSSVQALQQQKFKENITLVSSVQALLVQHQEQGRPVTIN
ncbi:hypothetical protein SK128_000397 [Halocaridina rubra]|uniref:RNase H type-1 domain-containing protein n=1 Tax=Halocaridina rubra TaxID=373956 RepID=A0AAN8WZA6_HALRR